VYDIYAYYNNIYVHIILYYLYRCIIIIIICPLVLRHRTHIVTYIMIIYSLTPKTRLPCSIYPLSVHPRYHHHRMRYGRPGGPVGTTRHIYIYSITCVMWWYTLYNRRTTIPSSNCRRGSQKKKKRSDILLLYVNVAPSMMWFG